MIGPTVAYTHWHVFTWIWETNLSWSQQMVLTGRERWTGISLSHWSVVSAGNRQPIKRLLISAELFSVLTKAGRLVGLAGCCAVLVLAYNATFLLAVDRIAAYRSHSAISTSIIICSRGSVGRASAPQSWGRGFESHLGQHFPTCLCPLRHTRSARDFPASASAEKATPKPHSLSLNKQADRLVSW